MLDAGRRVLLTALALAVSRWPSLLAGSPPRLVVTPARAVARAALVRP
jgi:hypothetical protein